MNKDNKIYHHNIEKIKERYPNILKSIEKEICNENINVEAKEARNRQKSLIMNNGEKKIHLQSRFNPQKEAERWVSDFKIREDKIYIVYGFGMIYHLKELVKKIDKSIKILIIEPSYSIFDAIIKNIDITDIIENQNVQLTVGKNEELLKDFINSNVFWNNVHMVEYNSFSNYKKFFGEKEKETHKLIKEYLLLKQIDRNTLITFNTEWQKNLITNMRYTIDSYYINQLENKFENKPVIIVSAGPSLNKNVELLKEIKEKAIIICVDTALKVLLNRNITPHFVITIDGGEKNLGHFDNLDYYDIPLVYMTNSHPDILEKHKGTKILITGPNEYTIELFNEFDREIGAVSLGGSVACVAFSVAKKIGGNPIIFIGQDLAYTNNKTHAKGTKYSTDSNSVKTKRFEVDGINGEKLATGHDLLSFLKWFENEIHRDKSGRKYIDATEGGAKIEGTEILSFRETIDKYCIKDITPTKIIDESLDEKSKFNRDELKLFINKFETMYDNLEKIKDKSKDAVIICNKIIDIYVNKNSKSNIQPKLNRLDNIDKYIKEKREEFDMINHLIKPIIFKVYLDSTTENNSKDDISIMKKSLEFYSNLSISVEFTLPILLETINDLKDFKKNNFS